MPPPRDDRPTHRRRRSELTPELRLPTLIVLLARCWAKIQMGLRLNAQIKSPINAMDFRAVAKCRISTAGRLTATRGQTQCSGRRTARVPERAVCHLPVFSISLCLSGAFAGC
jgi:hypothetical protein